MFRAFFTTDDLSLDAFADLCQQRTDPKAYPGASTVECNVLFYDGSAIRASTSAETQALRAEWAHCLSEGPGVFVIRDAYEHAEIVDQVTRFFRHAVAQEAAVGQTPGDHFGNNERLWNSLQKLCVADAEAFAHYFGNPLIHLASESWLGPSYRVTAQMNNVRPGGKSQSAHRDYHLGFQSAAVVAEFPAHAQVMSQFLTLQGAVAHCDMPPERGATMLLPYSHQFAPGYLAYQREDFRDYFAAAFVQPSLSKGDMMFFNPALFHGGGENKTELDRVANLLQISSAFGHTMESLDHGAMIESLYPVLLQLVLGGETERARHALAAATDGYPFPTNLDTDPPRDGNAPSTQRELVWQAVRRREPWETVRARLRDLATRRRP